MTDPHIEEADRCHVFRAWAVVGCMCIAFWIVVVVAVASVMGC